jgi:hypothetical protein
MLSSDFFEVPHDEQRHLQQVNGVLRFSSDFFHEQRQ